MLRWCHLPSLNKKINSYSLVLRQEPLIALQIQDFFKIFQSIRKSKEIFKFTTISTVMPKNTNKTKKPGTNLDLTTGS